MDAWWYGLSLPDLTVHREGMDVCQDITLYPPSTCNYRQGRGAGTVTQWLRTLAVLAERGSGSSSQHPRSGSRPLVTPGPRDLMSSFDLTGTEHTQGEQIHSGKTFIHRK